MKRSVPITPGTNADERSVVVQVEGLMGAGRIADLRTLLDSLDRVHGERFGGADLWTARLVILREDGPRDLVSPPSAQWQARATRLSGEVEAGLAFSGLSGPRLAALGLACVGLGWADLALRVSRRLIAEFDPRGEGGDSCLGEDGPFDLIPALLALLLDQGRRAEVDALTTAVAALGPAQQHLAQRWRALLPGAAAPRLAQARKDQVLTFLRWRALDDPTYFLDRGHWDEW